MRYQSFCKYMLVALMICCFCARGDVCKLDVMIKNSDSTHNVQAVVQQFGDFIKGNFEDQFYEQVKKHQLSSSSMPACGACIPDNADMETSYSLWVASKEKGSQAINNNPGRYEVNNSTYVKENVARLLYCDKRSHTERQLTITLLRSLVEQYFQGINVNSLNQLLNWLNIENEAKPDGSHFFEQISDQQLELLKQVRGVLLVHTNAAPCGARLPCNCDFSCIEYYQQLAKLTPNVEYHVCFPLETMVLDPNFAIFQKKSGNYVPLSVLHRFLTDNLKKQKQLNNNFKQLDNYLKQLNNNSKRPNIDDSTIKGLTGQARETLISKNNTPDSEEEKEKKILMMNDLFRSFYGIPDNVHIHFLDCKPIR